MRVLLVSTYELGHQPLHVASPAAALRAAGHDVACLDLAVQQWNDELVGWADAVAFSVPMHTAMRLAVRGAGAVRRHRPGLPVCFYGLYAPVSRDTTVGRVADRVIAGEYEPALVAWVDSLDAGRRLPAPDGGRLPVPEPAGLIQLGRSRFALPARELLPPLERYARAVVNGRERLAGYVEASHGCAHECRHCPVPTVYGGRVRLVSREVVLDDVARLVDDGARHITFGDPDFLNGWRHSLRVVRAMAERFDDLTFDCTVKVEHVLRHESLWPEFAAAGCVFTVCAVECLNDGSLRLLDKGHTAADAARAVTVLRDAGIEMRPSFLPFTPWTTARDLLDLLDFVVRNDLVGNVDPVQYTIRLLVPEGSLLLDQPAMQPSLEDYDAERLTWRWRAADPAMDRLQARLAALVERQTATDVGIDDAFAQIRAAVLDVAGVSVDDNADPIPVGSIEGRPRLTEPWFC